MKNLSAIPRLSLSETFTILITLVVCLAGFTEAEVHSEYGKRDSNQQEDNYLLKESYNENVPHSHQTSKITDSESEDKNVHSFNNIPESPPNKIVKRHSDDFGETESIEKDSDGYGYDDDEYYHFNFKRNNENLENNKEGKEGAHDEKEGVHSPKFMTSNSKEKSKEAQTIEMLSYQESHPNINSETNLNTMDNTKPYSDNLSRKKVPSSGSGLLTSLKMTDLRENSAIDEKMKERKDESGLISGTSDSKTGESKKSVKVTDEKDPVKLKESKLTEDSEKKQKEISLKDSKEAVVAKSLKESPKSTDEKEKSVKLSDTSKLEENLEKSKIKENDSPKLVNEDVDISRCADKFNSDAINPNGLTQLNNRASFVSNDYKDNMDTMKTSGVEEDEKTSEETNGIDNNVGLNDYQDGLRSREKLRNFYGDIDPRQNYGSFNTRDNTAQVFRSASKTKDFMPTSLDLQSLNSDLYKKRDSWKDTGAQTLKFRFSHPNSQQQQSVQEQSHLSQEQVVQQGELTADPRLKNSYSISFPPNELENTEYHKNYIKSLKRYKSMSEEQKGITPDTSSTGSVEKAADSKKKLQDGLKRRSMLSEESLQNKIPKLRRNVYKVELLSGQTQRSAVGPQNSQTLPESVKDETKLSDAKKTEEQQESNRPRRKSPVKLEYEIKVINQNPQDSKNSAELSHLVSRRFEKDLKTKLATEDKYLKKYPYSQVSRDDLMRLSETDSERKFKRKAPIWKRHEEKSVIQTRAVPSGYYGNRVKFGQKSYVRNNEQANTDAAAFDATHPSSSYFAGQIPAVLDKNKIQRSWEMKPQDFKHDPMKRYDESGYMNKGNSLLLVKKGERTATAFEDGTAQSASDNLNPDHLARTLSNDDYIILKQMENNNLEKISEAHPPTASFADLSAHNYARKMGFEGNQQENLKNSGKQQFKNKGLHARSFHSEKEEKKPSVSSHGPRSSLKKTFDKFRDLAGFFKDNEQESADNQCSTQELKEGRDIVFSEDKLPDPIVISNDANGKSLSPNQKPQNSIYSISTNFKTLDQQDKKSELPINTESDKNMFAESKSENMESSWEPALKNLFPEVKSINSMSKDGNEIIILDLNRNQLKIDHSYMNKPLAKAQQLGAFGLTSQVPENIPSGDKKIHIVLNPATSKLQPPSGAKTSQKGGNLSKVNLQNNKAYAVFRSGDNLDQFAVRGLVDLPTVLKALTEKKTSIGTKLLTKRSPPGTENKVSDNYNKFLRELNQLSELNKSSYKKGKLTKKRNAKEIFLPSSSFPELSTYSDANVKYLGNLLQNIMPRENPQFKDINELPAEKSNGEISRYLEDSLKSNQIYLNPEMIQSDRNSKYQSRWSTAEEKGRENFPLGEDNGNDLQGERGLSGDKNFQDELWAELEATSDKINRLRREGAGRRKLRKAIENSLAFGGEHNAVISNAFPDATSEKKCLKLSSETDGPSTKDKASFGGVAGGDLKYGSELKSETKESSDKSLKSDYENHLSEFFESLNANKNQKDHLIIPNENSWKRKKRKENHRRKRSASRDVKNKVSTSAVQNTILKKLGEDNYQSVYFPGIKRRLLSTNNEADDADNYGDAYERDKTVIAEETQEKCVKNSLNKCIDPIIVGLFGAVDKEEERNRARRSLTSGFHSDFKREIDLDESMPNDFQNFLVTSLGGFGSQKREVIKKDVALWEGKEGTQANANQDLEGSLGAREASEDSTLEKREVPSSENHKSQSYFPSAPSSNSNLADAADPVNHSDKKLVSENKSKLKANAEFNDEKLPTQIRIQITNASSKEKKSSKPIMDESETTSTEMENVPKEKEFFDKNKINGFRVNERPKVHSLSKSKFTFSDYEEPESVDNPSSQKPYHPYRRRRKKKKYVLEDPVKPVKDFIKFDQKTMETFLKRIMTDQNMAADQTTQKSSVSNHLPQVETVYNPTQGTNKAQLQISRFGKINSASNKNTGTVKNNFQSNDLLGYDDGVLRSYLKDKMDKIKGDKVKEYDDVDWRPTSGKMRLRQDLGWEPADSFTLPTLKTPMADSPTFSLNAEPPPYPNPFIQHLYGQKSHPLNSNYFFHPSYSDNANTLYNDLKLKQSMKSPNTFTGFQEMSKVFHQPFYYNAMKFNKMDEKGPNLFFPGSNTGDGIWNYDYPFTKNTNSQGYKIKDYFGNGIKDHSHVEAPNKITQTSSRKFVKNLEGEKSSAVEVPQSSHITDGTKDGDYLDDEYLDDDALKDLQAEDSLVTVPAKKANHLYDPHHRLYNYKNTDVDDDSNEEDEEFDEDYEENNDDEDFDDYSLLTNSKTFDPETMRLGHGDVKFQTSLQSDNPLSPLNYVFPKENLLELRGHSFEQTEFTNPKHDLKYDPGRQQIPFVDVKSDVGSLTGSTNLLKQANENANIFEKNLMKNAYSYDLNDGQDWFSKDKMKELNALYRHNKLRKRKLEGKPRRSREHPQIGSRLFYAAKTEINDDTVPLTLVSPRKNIRSSRHSHHPPGGWPRCNPLNAEFADADNGFESESEENDKHFNENVISFGKNFQEERKTENDGGCEKNSAGLEDDVAENLEDDGETISEDDVLENVIGKYIMRKRVASSADLNKSPESSSKKEENKVEGKHKLRKRSLGRSKYNERAPEVRIVKRLSSGHLTEKNFRKYHKKNLNRKREIKEFDFDRCENAGINREGKNTLRKQKKRENPTQTKRSALDLFKKITNKDRDMKKVENVDGRTAGFEPLSSLSDKKYESSIGDAKLDFLTQVKKLSNESPQTQMKSNVVELKAHYPNEGPFTLDQRKKDKGKVAVVENPVPATTGQGPWRIELDDKYDVSIADFPEAKSFANVKEVDAFPSRQENDNLKAFLVFSKNVRSSKRSTAEGLPATSGSSQKEVGNSYRPKSDEGRGIYKMPVRKRSLDSFIVTVDDEDPAEMSRDHFTRQQTTETHVSLKEKNRALHDKKSLSEGDSKPRPPRVLQRNAKNIRSFVNDEEQCQSARFPPVGKLKKTESVFPPSNNVNIMRDGRQVNEETSKYLGQQIVDAILSHVSANPKFKELIAPGLAVRTTAYKENIEVKKRPLHQVDVPDQLQYFLQKFMLDLEKLAEKHVRKRMCSQIDEQSKQFLQSLLNLPGNTQNGDKTFNGNENCPISENYSVLEGVKEVTTASPALEMPETEPPASIQQNSPAQEELEYLMRKHCLLLKLIDDYEKLSKFEKDSLGVNYQYLLEELDQTNRDLGSLKVTPSISVTEFCSRNYQKDPSDIRKNIGGLKQEVAGRTMNVTTECKNCSGTSRLKNPPPKWEVISNNSRQPKPNPANDKTEVKAHVLPTLFFEEDPNSQEAKSTPAPIFEGVDSVNMTRSVQNKQNATQERLWPGDVDALFLPPPIPQTFDLLPCQNSTQKAGNLPTDQPPGSSESVRFKESLSGADTLENSNDRIYSAEEAVVNPSRPTELHKLSLGDAAGLQLSLKNRGQWVSNLDVAKVIRNVPGLPDPSKVLSLIKAKAAGNSAVPKTVDAPSVADVKNSRSLIAPSNEYSSLLNPELQKKTLGFAVVPYFNFGMSVPKRRPFENVSRNFGSLKTDKIPSNYFVRKVSTSGRKRVFLRSNYLKPPSKDKKMFPGIDPSNRNDIKKNRLFPQSPFEKKENSRKDESKNPEVTNISNNDDEKDAALEYLVWSTMPAVRRQLNNLESGIDFDDFFLKNPKVKISKGGGDKPV